MKKAFLICICGRKNTGKTTLIVNLIRELTRRGITVATVKHDGHRFSEEPKETDTWRHREAGAMGSAVFSKGKLMIVKERQDHLKEEEMACRLTEMFPEADIILAEGLKGSILPKIELVRNSYSTVSEPSGRVGIVADAVNVKWWKKKEAGCVWEYEAVEQICDMILEMARSDQNTAKEK